MHTAHVERTVFFALLILCLAVSLLALFLPFAQTGSCGSRHEIGLQHDYGPVSAFSLLRPGRCGNYLRSYADQGGAYGNYLLFAVIFGFLTAISLLVSLIRTLRALDREDSHRAELALGVGPWIGTFFFVLLILLGLFAAPPAHTDGIKQVEHYPTFWPFLGTACCLCALRLAWVLNRDCGSGTDAEPAED